MELLTAPNHPINDISKSEDLESATMTLANRNAPLTDRFDALFTLRSLKTSEAALRICQCFQAERSADSGAVLINHEFAYVLGQMGLESALPTLFDVLSDPNENPIVRHEAGEAVGAIASPNSLDILDKYSHDSRIEVAQTCQLAAERIRWAMKQHREPETLPSSPYYSVDPAPPSAINASQLSVAIVAELGRRLVDSSQPLFERYRAMFALRNVAGDETRFSPELSAHALRALSDALHAPDSALFRHEIAYVLGQIQKEAAVPALRTRLADLNEHYMVRHECAEALGSIGTDECRDVLSGYLHDGERIVRESCIVALGIADSNSTN